ncbi:hypothetical protein [Bordetella sp. 15P40C-2]|uniref:hypothetical protein n=1 Tax=Bordetella sp. 15P40C-2 TaxID=2572246 RepID=UPI001323D9E9|nr:hypothetical protein [Bordetella sp. 15P40C-2]MVW72281.1 hypothetical protein [Bordetella sp. 15P40C-2]
MNAPFPIRQPCPPGACICDHDRLLETPGADIRILRLTRQEEKKLLLRLENLASLDDLRRMQERLHALLGITLTVHPGANEVRTVRGLQIEVAPMPGLCSKTRQTIPAAVRRGLDRNPAIVYELLNSHDLLGGL